MAAVQNFRTLADYASTYTLHVDYPACRHHFKLSATRRLELLLDDGRWTEHDRALMSTDPLEFVDTKPYKKRLRDAQTKLGVADAILTAEGRLAGRHLI